MDIIKPNVVWIGRRCYRDLSANSNSKSVNYAEEDAYDETTVYQDDLDCGMEVEDLDIEALENGKFKASFPVASIYYSYLIGRQGATKKRIETETYTQIRIPGKGQTGDVAIIGRDVKTVRQAKIRIDVLVDSARKKAPFTHFISIPICKDDIQQRFLQFKKEVLEKCGHCRGVEESIFQNPQKLHLTLCVLVLADENERQHGILSLNNCVESVIRPALAGEELKIKMSGIEYMNDDPGEVDVLYGKVNDLAWTEKLQDLSNAIVDNLVKAGIANRQYEKVKLHVTLMNTIFRQDNDGESDKTNGKQRESFAADEILQEFGDFDFGEMILEEIHLSVRYTTAKNGFYSASTTVGLLPNK